MWHTCLDFVGASRYPSHLHVFLALSPQRLLEQTEQNKLHGGGGGVHKLYFYTQNCKFHFGGWGELGTEQSHFISLK